MHEKRILHRDLKSQNIFMTNVGIIKIGDLGIAKVMTSQNQTVVGTCSYISPEICEARRMVPKILFRIFVAFFISLIFHYFFIIFSLFVIIF